MAVIDLPPKYVVAMATDEDGDGAATDGCVRWHLPGPGPAGPEEDVDWLCLCLPVEWSGVAPTLNPGPAWPAT
jgi:hypothetical protein